MFSMLLSEQLFLQLEVPIAPVFLERCYDIFRVFNSQIEKMAKELELHGMIAQLLFEIET